MAISDLNIPVLETPRLILRGHSRADFEDMLPIWQDPLVMRHIHGVALTREDLWGRFMRGMGSWAVNGFGMWAVIDKASGDYAGIVGCFEMKREIEPRIEDMPEAGWTFAARFHGLGYATEAVQAALAWMDAKHPGPIYCITSAENTPSMRVAEKCGFALWFDTTYQGEATKVFRRAAKP